MHNAPLLMRGGRTHAARVHPDDAERLGVADGERCRISSPHGSIEIDAMLTDEVKPGTIAVPHGWGHTGTAAGASPRPPAARTSTCSPPRIPRTSSDSPGWRT